MIFTQPTGSIGGVPSLGDDPLKPVVAGDAQENLSVRLDLLGQSKGVFAACRHQPFQKMASRGEFGSSEVVAVGWKLSID